MAHQVLGDAGEVVRFLRDRGVVGKDERVRVRPLGGGVSNEVFGVWTESWNAESENAESRNYVVKQSLGRLRVADEWLAPRSRTVTEAAAMRLAAELTPEAVPRLIDCDESNFALVMTMAPAGWTEWKRPLLNGDVECWAGTALGAILARWHSSTVDGDHLPAALADPAALVSLRIDPYHREVARRRPELASPVNAAVDRLLARRVCLVHGDFSPKNVLIGATALWVTDFEVAHLGDPTFDLAFLVTHLLLKSVHRPLSASRYQACAEAFLTAYRHAVPASLWPEPEHLTSQIGCLLAARVDGKSPAEYLTSAERVQVRKLAATLLHEPQTDLSTLWHSPRRRTP